MNDYLKNLFSLDGKVAIVTGSSRGIGASICNGLSLAGATTVGIGRSANSSGEFAGSDYRQCDINDKLSFASLCADVVKEYGQLDILVNAAGISLPAGSDGYSEFENIVSTNLSATFHCCKEAIAYMELSGGGSIINVTSIASAQGFPGNPGYVASKGGVRSLTRALAFDFSDKGVRVNNVAPGYIHTDMTDKSFKDPELNQKRTEHMMIKRWGQPEDIIGAVIYLASDASSYVTGADLFVDGGWTAKGI